jgi:hypothetical protein
MGVPYPFDLLTHCGIRWARFDGRNWAPAEPLPEPRPTADPKTGVTVYTGYTAGYMILVTADTARFQAPGVVTVDFHPLNDAPSACA